MSQAHGGDLDRAIATYGGRSGDWIDLSTGINRDPYPLPMFAEAITATLPTKAAVETNLDAARAAYGTSAPGVVLAGAQAAIQLAPRLVGPGDVRIVAPTYSEHGIAFARAGQPVREVGDVDELAGAAVGVVVNPNNPDGRRWQPETLIAAARGLDLLIVDESFADPEPQLSLCPHLPLENVLVLRSFGKFYGRAGLRLGFAFGTEALVSKMVEEAGPWAVNGPALALGAEALRDRDWRDAATARLLAGASRLDGLAREAGWAVLGGTTQFRLYDVGDAASAQARLAERQIWTRAFEAHPRWLRLGIPGEGEWTRVAAALLG